jgi:hypothetical protein
MVQGQAEIGGAVKIYLSRFGRQGRKIWYDHPHRATIPSGLDRIFQKKALGFFAEKRSVKKIIKIKDEVFWGGSNDV